MVDFEIGCDSCSSRWLPRKKAIKAIRTHVSSGVSQWKVRRFPASLNKSYKAFWKALVLKREVWNLYWFLLTYSYRRSWYFHSKIIDSLTAWLERQDSAELQLARPWMNLEYLSENTNFYGIVNLKFTAMSVFSLLQFRIYIWKIEMELSVCRSNFIQWASLYLWRGGLFRIGFKWLCLFELYGESGMRCSEFKDVMDAISTWCDCCLLNGMFSMALGIWCKCDRASDPNSSSPSLSDRTARG